MTKGSTEMEKWRWRRITKALAVWRRRGIQPVGDPTDPEPLTRQVRRARERSAAKGRAA